MNKSNPDIEETKSSIPPQGVDQFHKDIRLVADAVLTGLNAADLDWNTRQAGLLLALARTVCYARQMPKAVHAALAFSVILEKEMYLEAHLKDGKITWVEPKE